MSSSRRDWVELRARRDAREARSAGVAEATPSIRATEQRSMAMQIAPVLDRLGYAVENGPRMRVLFASGIDGFCHRYAVLHWAEQLATQAIASTVRAHSDPRLAADLATHDVLVLYRVPDGAWVRHLLAHARALGVATVFAVDDLIFEPALAD